MFVREHTHPQWDLAKWLVLIGLASALALAFGAKVGGGIEPRWGADPETEIAPPGLLPDVNPFEPAPLMGAPVDAMVPPVGEDVAMNVWGAIEAQRQHRYEDAAAIWSNIEMPCQTEVWKHVALGQAWLAMGEVRLSADALAAARDLEPDNAVVRYYFGLLRLTQARHAEDWYDAVGPTTIRLVSLRDVETDAAHAGPPYDIAPNSKSMYELSAIMELEAAIDRAPDVAMDQPLVPATWPTAAAIEPTVHDLLTAMQAENFVPKAHNVLGSLYLTRGSLEQAEEHMDAAVNGGLTVLGGYEDLAREYKEEGRPTDAARAYLKSVREEPAHVTNLLRAWGAFR